MFPNWHLCCPGVYSAENSSFAFRVDAESVTPSLVFTAADHVTALAARTRYPPRAAISRTKAAALTPARHAWAPWTGHAALAGDRRGLIAGCGGTRKRSGLPWLLARRERQHFPFPAASGRSRAMPSPVPPQSSAQGWAQSPRRGSRAGRCPRLLALGCSPLAVSRRTPLAFRVLKAFWFCPERFIIERWEKPTEQVMGCGARGGGHRRVLPAAVIPADILIPLCLRDAVSNSGL